jgi:hypothetical protein
MEDNVKMVLGEVGCEGVNQIQLVRVESDGGL